MAKYVGISISILFNKTSVWNVRTVSYRNGFSDLPLLRGTNESENYLSWFQCEQHWRSIVFPRFPSRVYTHSRLPESKLREAVFSFR